MNTTEMTRGGITIEEIDEALRNEKEIHRVHKEEQFARAAEESVRISRISTFLRYVGIGVLLVGVSCFLFQRWGEVNHFQRYLLFLGFTGTVCGAGLWCGLGIKENKGARTLLGTVLALIPVHCAQLGAMLYSQVGSNFEHHPNFLRWNAGDMTHALLAIGIGLGVMAPLAYFSYSVLARRYAKDLCLIGFGVSSLLLIPTRAPLYAASLLLVGAVVTAWGERRFLRIPELKTKEGLVARAIPIAALAMLVGRQYLYDSSTFFIGTLFGFGALALLALARNLSPYRWIVSFVEFQALISAICSGLFCSHAIVSSLEVGGTIIEPLIRGVPLAVGLSIMGAYAIACRVLFNSTAAIVVFLTGLVELSHYDPTGKVVALIVGVMTLWMACLGQQRSLLISGSTLTVVALFTVLRQVIFGVPSSVWWIALSITGVATVIGASYFERYFTQFRDATIAARTRIGEWE